MEMRIILCMLVVAGFATHVARAADTPQPNVILLMADDLGWGDTGYNGHPKIKTPHLDQMASDGIRFDRFYSASAVCSPTRASCVTGRNPFRTGVFYANDGILRTEEVTVYEVLKEQGYSTGHFGKWHLGTFTNDKKDGNRGGSRFPQLFNLPSQHGVDLYFATESKVPTCDPMKQPENQSSKAPWDYLKPGEPFKPYGTAYWSNRSGKNDKVTDNLEGDDSRVMMDRAIPFIKQAVSDEKPFLAVIWFHAPHKPCVAAPEFHQMYQDEPLSERNYYGCITGMDKEIGRLRASLQELGIADNTMVWFCSDNGPEKGPGVSGGFRERKRSLYEGGVRVPGLLVWPDKIKQGRVELAPAVTSDYLPTIMECGGHSGVAHSASAGRRQPDAVDRRVSRLIRIAPSASCAARKPATRPSAISIIRTAEGQWNCMTCSRIRMKRRTLLQNIPRWLKTLKDQFLVWQADVKRSFEGAEYGTESVERMKQGEWQDVLKPRSKKRSRKSQK